MELNLNYVHSESMGYGQMGVKLAAALEAKGVTIFDHLPSPDQPTAEGRRAGIAHQACWLSTTAHVDGWWATQRPSILTMWEANVLPESFRESIDNLDVVLVPSDHNVELFSRWHSNVKRVLLGVDPAEWHYTERSVPGRWFDFLIGGSGARKGVDLAWKAFLAAFPDGSWGTGPIPRLVMKSPKGYEGAGDPPITDRIMVVGGKLPTSDLISLYASAHCYLQPSRGEGFGLQPLQAIAQGLPTILTDAHGHASFAHLGWGLDTTLAQSDYFIYGDAGDWWEPDFDQLVDHMRWMYDNWGTAVERARHSAAEVATSFTWANTAEQFVDALDLDDTPHTPTGEWRKPVRKLYRVRTVRDMECDIGAAHHRFVAGEDNWVSADAKRVLAEAGALTQDCITEDDSGLTPEQVKRLDLGPDPYCPHCGQREGSGKTRADDILGEIEADAEGDPALTAWHAGA